MSDISDSLPMAGEDTEEEEDLSWEEELIRQRRMNSPEYVGEQATRRVFMQGIEVDERLQDGKIISKSEAKGIIMRRLSDDPRVRTRIMEMGGLDTRNPETHNQTTARANLAEKLVELLPDEMRTDKMLGQGDLRALMVDLLPEGEYDTAGDLEIGGVKFTKEERQWAAGFVEAMTTEVASLYSNALTDTPGSEQAGANIATTAQNLAQEFRDGKMNYLPEDLVGGMYFNPTTGKFETQPNSSPELGSLTFDINEQVKGNQTPTRFLNSESLQRMLQSGEMTFQDARSVSQRGGVNMVDPETEEQYRLEGDARVLYSDRERPERFDKEVGVGYGPDGRPMYTQDPRTQEKARWQKKDWYSLSDILRLPHEMTPAELNAVHEKMKAAGVYAQAGGEPTVPDVTDPKFKAAWQLLASQSLETGESMTSLLEDRAAKYKKELEGAFASQLTDPARLRINGNALARDAIGRKLNDEEQMQLIQFIHDLERNNARVAAGLEATRSGETVPGIESLDEGVMKDIDAQMQEWIREQNPEEAEGADTADQFEMFRNMLAGPGRGGAF